MTNRDVIDEQQANADPEVDLDTDRDPVEELAEEFLARRRRGESAAVSEYAEAHPEIAARIRDLFPTLLLLEDLKPGSAPTGSHRGLAAANDVHVQQQLGDFRILREIGRGGMGVVYEAAQESLGRHVALKVLPAACIASAKRLERFHREAQAAARLHHTNIVPVFGVGEQNGIHYYVMQFIPGQGLDQVLVALRHQATAPETLDCDPNPTLETVPTATAFSAAQAAKMLLAGPVTPDSSTTTGSLGDRQSESPSPVMGAVPTGPRYWRSVARVGIQVADALEYAHRAGTLHRDIKPANLLLDPNGTVWIADFGLAKLADVDDLTHSGDVIGTLRYMAPEQFAGAADARSDVYSLGLTLYELLTLAPAFGEKDRRRLIRQVTQEEPPRPRKLNPAIPRDLETIVVKAIAANPAHRYRSSGELAADLRCFLEDRPIRARRVTPLGRMWRWCRRNRAVATLTGLAAALLVAVAVVASVGYLRTNQALARVSAEREVAEEARQQAETERARTRTERERAEANLHLATKAFEEIFSKVASDRVTPLAEQDDDEQLPDPAWETVFTGKDAALLESMLKFYDQFAQQNDANFKLRRETARAYRRVGDIQRRLGQYAKAETAYRHALTMYQGLVESVTESSADARTAVAGTHNELGVLYRSTGRHAEARLAFEQALEVLGKEPQTTAALPESRYELARTYAFLSTTQPGYAGSGNAPGQGSSAAVRRPRRTGADRPGPGEAVENNRRALEILAELTQKAPENPRYLLAMARSQRDRYALTSRAGRKEEANAAKQQAIQILERLVNESPQNPDYRHELAETFATLPGRSREAKRTEDEMKQLARAVAIESDLVTRYPAVPEYKASLARSYLHSAEGLRTVDVAAATEHRSKATGLMRELVVEYPTLLSYRMSLARLLVQLAETEMARHEPAKARAILEEAIASSQQIPEPAATAGPPLRMMLAVEYSALVKVLRELGEGKLADETAAKAAAVSPRATSPTARGFRHDRPRP